MHFNRHVTAVEIHFTKVLNIESGFDGEEMGPEGRQEGRERPLCTYPYTPPLGG